MPRLIAFCMAETQAIAARRFLVSGIIGAPPEFTSDWQNATRSGFIHAILQTLPERSMK
jgi:hypothetical protein